LCFKVPFEEDEEMAENEPNGRANRCAVLSSMVAWGMKRITMAIQKKGTVMYHHKL